jgi:hypothetical protein
MPSPLKRNISNNVNLENAVLHLARDAKQITLPTRSRFRAHQTATECHEYMLNGDILFSKKLVNVAE